MDIDELAKAIYDADWTSVWPWDHSEASRFRPRYRKMAQAAYVILVGDRYL